MSLADPGPVEPLVLHCHTRARRYPQVVGKIAGYTLRSPITLPQFVTAVAAGFVLIETRAVWAHLSWWGNVAVLVLVPAGLAALLRRARIEGRSPYLAAMGYLGLLTSPRRGRHLGQSPPRVG
ncbi:MAG: hypothetical protein L0Y54_23225, partial [Sporichthyaceae bacterium]|nr:hypothetical protein [Sporichthyaceae bacterium]